MKKFLICALIFITIFAVSWAISTGIWLVLLLLKNSFSREK